MRPLLIALAVTLVVFGLLFAAAIWLCGVRFNTTQEPQ
jgi:hypothetical protein